jgi:hypothetical protein
VPEHNHTTRFVVVPYSAGAGRRKRDAAPQFGVVSAVYSSFRLWGGKPYALVRRLGNDGLLVQGEDSWTCQRVGWQAGRGFSPCMTAWVTNEELSKQVTNLRNTGEDAAAVASWHRSDLQDPVAIEVAMEEETNTPTGGRPQRERRQSASLQAPPSTSRKRKESGADTLDDEGGDAPVQRSKCACVCKCKNTCRGKCKSRKSNRGCSGKCNCKCKCTSKCTCDGACGACKSVAASTSSPPSPKMTKPAKERKEKKKAQKKELARLKEWEEGEVLRNATCSAPDFKETLANYATYATEMIDCQAVVDEAKLKAAIRLAKIQKELKELNA